MTPNSPIKSTAAELKDHFVHNINNDKRKILYDNYIRYSNDLKALLNDTQMVQWVDGSFVTKKTDPGDIDLVTFIDSTVIDKIKDKIHPFRYPNSLEQYGVDAYVVAIYDRADRRYPLFVADSMYWLDAFDKSQRSRTGVRHPKGFLEINY